MKDKALTIITVMLIGIFLLIFVQSCKEDHPEPNGEEVFTNRISQTWDVKQVTVDNIDVTGTFKDMSITFRADETYSVSNAVSPIWPPSGLFEIIPANNEQYNIKRSDGAAIDVTFLSDSSVFLELFYTSQSGRVSGVSGNYRFELTR
jgi:hypothetical protein